MKKFSKQLQEKLQQIHTQLNPETTYLETVAQTGRKLKNAAQEFVALYIPKDTSYYVKAYLINDMQNIAAITAEFLADQLTGQLYLSSTRERISQFEMSEIIFNAINEARKIYGDEKILNLIEQKQFEYKTVEESCLNDFIESIK